MHRHFYFECKWNWYRFWFGCWFGLWTIKMSFKHEHNLWLELGQTNKQWEERCGENRGVDGKLNMIWLNQNVFDIQRLLLFFFCVFVYVFSCYLVIFRFFSRVFISFFLTWCVLYHFHVDKRCTYFLQGSTQMPQHFSMPLKFFSASRISALIWSMPSSTRSNCSVCSAHNQHQHSKSCRIKSKETKWQHQQHRQPRQQKDREKKTKRKMMDYRNLC